jgi:RNA polymerase sigma-70 factor (ECF subfamily)
MTDGEIIDKYKSGGRREKSLAFSMLYDKYQMLVRSYCSSMIGQGQEADDIFQETFIVLHRNLEQNKDIKYVKAFLISIAKNQIRNLWRDRKNNVEINPEDFFYDPNPAQNQQEMIGLIKNALPLMDEKYREAFVLREFSGLAYQEIADILDMTLSGAKTRVARAHEKISSILKPYIQELKVFSEV